LGIFYKHLNENLDDNVTLVNDLIINNAKSSVLAKIYLCIRVRCQDSCRL
jgi:hypothetical protein